MKVRTWLKDLKECGWDTPVDFFWFYILKGCGCGNGDTFMTLAWGLFEAIALKKEDRFSIFSDERYEILAHWMDSLGLIEHGSNISGSWCTKEGQDLYENIIAEYKNKNT